MIQLLMSLGAAWIGAAWIGFLAASCMYCFILFIDKYNDDREI